MTIALEFGSRKQVPVVMQAEVAECGLACIAMVAAFYGFPFDMPELRRRFQPSARGTTLADMMRIADELAFTKRALRLDLQDITALRKPAVLHWNLNHFVVLERVDGHSFVIVDPARGRLKLKREQISEHFTGVALEIFPAPERKDHKVFSPSRIPSLLDLLGDTAPYSGVMTRIVAMTFALQIMVLVNPWLMQIVIDRVLLPADTDVLLLAGVGFGFLAFYKALLTGFRAWAVNHLVTNVSANVLNDMFKSLLSLPISYFMRRHIGDVLSRFQSADHIHRTITTGLIEGAVDGILSITVLLAMLLYHPKLAMFAATFCLAYVCFRLVLVPTLHTAAQGRIESLARRDSEFLESIRGMTTIRSMNIEAARIERFADRQIRYLNDSTKVARLESIFAAGSSLIFGLEYVVIISLGALAILNSEISLGMFMAFISYKTVFLERAAKFTELLIELRLLRLHVDRVSDIIFNEPEIAVSTPPQNHELFGEIHVQDLGFRYAEHEPWLFRGLSFHVATGQSAAIVGASGCGKSTLLRLLVGILAPEEGEIRYDGHVLAGERRRWLRDGFGIVMQDDRLFAGTVAENIAAFDPFSQQRWIEEVARLASIHADILNMPMRYETRVGDMGDSLSGGQRQRIVLARALYRKPKILFLDEATSHLDKKMEAAVDEALASLDVTRILITHRESTIKNAEQIIRIPRRE